MDVQLTSGELRMVEHARVDARTIDSLLEGPLEPEDIHQAKKHARQIAAAMEYLSSRAAGNPPPQQGGA